jgi:hypothetical protein
MTAPRLYELRVGGRLAEDWSDWFEGFSLRDEEAEVSVLVGPVADSAALHGILAKVSDLNLTLVSIRQIDPG